MKKKLLISILALIVVVLILLPFVSRKRSQNIQLITTRAYNGEFELSVTATGSIQPLLKVDVGTQVSGIVKKLYVDFNSVVKRGDLLAELDKSTLQERVSQSRATLNKAINDSIYSSQNYNRVNNLFKKGAATESAYEEALNRLNNAVNTVSNSRADLRQSLLNLSYADIYSPISGKVLNRSVDEGQTVAASFNTPTLFTIANDLTKMQVEAKVDEADIGRIEKGQKAVFTVDTYPGEKFEGEVSQIRLEPTVVSNVVTYTVIINAPNPTEKLFPGMTANITIVTQSPKGICIPSEALYFDPSTKEMGEIIVEKSSENGNKVWVKSEKGIRSVPVNVGASDGVTTVILSGVVDGEEIVTGVQNLNKKDAKKSASIMPPPPGKL